MDNNDKWLNPPHAGLRLVEGVKGNNNGKNCRVKTRPVLSTPPYAFTLSEVLITIVIIGIVAAITIPNLIVHHQKQETLSRLKKAYSTLSQGLRKSQSENGAYSEWEKGDDITDVNLYFNKYWKPYFNHIRIFNNGKEAGYKTNHPLSWIDGTKPGTSFETSSTRILFGLNDGTIFLLMFKSGDSFQNRIYVDINGSRNPNILGKDVFIFKVVDNDNVKPYGREDYSSFDNECKTRGEYCAAKIIADGWEMKSDYPW